MGKVALIVIYNHQYNQNIDIIEALYKDRFSHIYHLVPFYKGDLPNVIPVYENSFYFQGYVAQGLKSYINKEFDHYFFIADDLLLNPIVNENNYHIHLKLEKGTCFLPEFISLHKRSRWWPRTREAATFNILQKGVEVENQLPPYIIALQKFKYFGLNIEPLTFKQVWPTDSLKELMNIIQIDPIGLIYHMFSFKKRYYLTYPMIGGYSDIFVVNADVIKQFSHYCGVFAATRLFVEIALPTSMVLAAKDIVTEKDLSLRGRALWDPNDYKILDPYGNNIKRLLEAFPETYLYLHPIKLSKWAKEFEKSDYHNLHI